MKVIKYPNIDSTAIKGDFIVTENIVGSNLGVGFIADSLHIQTRNQLLKPNSKVLGLNEIFDQLLYKITEIKKILKCDFLVYGQLFGITVPRMEYYDLESELEFKSHSVFFRAFDLFKTDEKDFVKYSEAIEVFKKVKLPHVPILDITQNNLHDLVKKYKSAYSKHPVAGFVLKENETLSHRKIFKIKRNIFKSPDRFKFNYYVNEDRFISAYSKMGDDFQHIKLEMINDSLKDIERDLKDAAEIYLNSYYYEGIFYRYPKVSHKIFDKDLKDLIVTEKINGSFLGIGFNDNSLHVQSKHGILKPYSEVFGLNEIFEILCYKITEIKNILKCNFMVYGEIFGKTNFTLKYYDPESEFEFGSPFVFFRAFDLYKIDQNMFVKYSDAVEIFKRVKLPHVPILDMVYDDGNHLYDQMENYKSAYSKYPVAGFVLKENVNSSFGTRKMFRIKRRNVQKKMYFSNYLCFWTRFGYYWLSTFERTMGKEQMKDKIVHKSLSAITYDLKDAVEEYLTKYYKLKDLCVDQLQNSLDKMCQTTINFTTGSLFCGICLQREKEICFLNCNHIFSCELCSEKLEHCPICRKRILYKKRVYIS